METRQACGQDKRTQRAIIDYSYSWLVCWPLGMLTYWTPNWFLCICCPRLLQFYRRTQSVAAATHEEMLNRKNAMNVNWFPTSNTNKTNSTLSLRHCGGDVWTAGPVPRYVVCIRKVILSTSRGDMVTIDWTSSRCGFKPLLAYSDDWRGRAQLQG